MAIFLSSGEQDTSNEETYTSALRSPFETNRLSSITGSSSVNNTSVPTYASKSAEQAQRDRRLRLAIFSSILTKPLAVIIPLVTVPLFLKYLGKERYGLYETIISLAGWMSLTNLGLGLGLMNQLTGCYVSHDRQLARRHVSTLFYATAILMAGFAVALLAAVPFVDWNSFFRTSMPHSELGTAIALAGVLSLVTVFSNLLSPIYSAYQELDRFNYWDGASKLFALISCFVLVQSQLGLLGVLVAILGAPVIVRLANLIFLFAHDKPWLSPKPALFEWALLKPMLAEGLCFFLLQMAGVVLFSTDKIIISTCLGPAAVTDYAVVCRLFLMGYGIYTLFLTPMWPAYGEALRRGDIGWVKRNLKLSLWLGCGGIGTLGILLLWRGDTLFKLWIGHSIQIQPSLIIGLTLTFGLRAWVDCRSVIFNSAGFLRQPIYYWSVQALLNLILSFVLVRLVGVLGVAWAGVISALLTTFWGYPLMMKRFLKAAEHHDLLTTNQK